MEPQFRPGLPSHTLLFLPVPWGTLGRGTGLVFGAFASPTALWPSFLSLFETFPSFTSRHHSGLAWAVCTVLNPLDVESWAGTMKGQDLCWAGMRRLAASQVKLGIWAWGPGL